jgi:hypothetical protein
MDELHMLLFVRMMIVVRWPDQVHFQQRPIDYIAGFHSPGAEHLNSYALFHLPEVPEYPLEPPANFRALAASSIKLELRYTKSMDWSMNASGAFLCLRCHRKTQQGTVGIDSCSVLRWLA